MFQSLMSNFILFDYLGKLLNAFYLMTQVDTCIIILSLTAFSLGVNKMFYSSWHSMNNDRTRELYHRMKSTLLLIECQDRMTLYQLITKWKNPLLISMRGTSSFCTASSSICLERLAWYSSWDFSVVFLLRVFVLFSILLVM